MKILKVVLIKDKNNKNNKNDHSCSTMVIFIYWDIDILVMESSYDIIKYIT